MTTSSTRCWRLESSSIRLISSQLVTNSELSQGACERVEPQPPRIRETQPPFGQFRPSGGDPRFNAAALLARGTHSPTRAKTQVHCFGHRLLRGEFLRSAG